MSSSSFRVNVLIGLLTLGMMSFLAGCSPTLTTPTSAIEADRDIVAEICARAWLPQSYSSRDTEQTQLEARAGNAGRSAYCG